MQGFKIKKKHLFSDAKLKIKKIMSEIQGRNDAFYDNRLKKVEDEIFNSEEAFINVSKQIEQLINELDSYTSLSNLPEAIKTYLKIKSLSKSIGESRIIEKYPTILKNFESIINTKFEELKKLIKTLVDRGLNELKNKNIEQGTIIYQEITSKILKYKDEIYLPYYTN